MYAERVSGGASRVVVSLLRRFSHRKFCRLAWQQRQAQHCSASAGFVHGPGTMVARIAMLLLAPQSAAGTPYQSTSYFGQPMLSIEAENFTISNGVLPR